MSNSTGARCRLQDTLWRSTPCAPYNAQILNRPIVQPLVLCISALLLGAGATAPVTAPSPIQPAVIAEFREALQRVRQHVPEPPDSAALRQFIIYDYLLAARLDRDLDLRPGEELDDAIDAFLNAHAGEPVIRTLRTDWLTQLAARHRWDWFLPRAADVSTPALLCARLAARQASTADPKALQEIAAEAIARWSQPQKPLPECESVYAWLGSQGLLTPERIEARVRAALAVDNPRLAREFAAGLPADRAAPLLQWAHLIESPRTALFELAQDSSAPVDTRALTAAFDKLARTDATIALALLPQLELRPDLTPQAHVKLKQLAALGAAYGRDPGAIAAFEQLPESAVEGDVPEWRVRAALWAGDYRRARAWIEAMPASLSSQPRWRYWRARAVEQLDGAAAASALYADIASLRDYYGYLAADRLKRGYELNARPTPEDSTVQKRLASEPGMQRAHALFDCGMNDEAAVEWAVALNGEPSAVRIQAARLAAAWGWYAQSIGTLAQLGELDDVRLRYPRPYRLEISQASQRTRIPEDWILAVMRQESLFRDDAVSRAGARGLMQMTPSTAAAVAKRWHLPPPRRDSVTDPVQDVARGAAHLRDLLDKYGQLGPSLAAYNAGAIPVARWLPPRPMDADVWIENIPYGETRTYVQRILEHIVAFAWTRDAEPPRLSGLLPPVSPTLPAVAGGGID